MKRNKYRTEGRLVCASGTAYSAEGGCDAEGWPKGPRVLQADRNETRTFGAQRDDNIQHAIACWNGCEDAAIFRPEVLTDLTCAAQAVLDNWERGDLAAAVQDLSSALSAVRGE